MQAIEGNIIGKSIGDAISNPELKRKGDIAINEVNKGVYNANSEISKALSNSEISPILSKFLPESFIHFYPKFHVLCFILGLLLMIILYSLNQINYNKDDFLSEFKINFILLIFVPYVHIIWLILKMAQHILLLL
jgi:hypothetical protein